MTSSGRGLTIIMAAFAMAGCAAVVPLAGTQSGLLQTLIVKGSLSYRQRIALPPGSVAQVTIIDVSIADRPAEVLASQTLALGTRQVPISFEIVVDRSRLKPNHRYALRSTIVDAEDVLLWTTASAHSVEIGSPVSDLGELTLVQVR